ncbi:MAG TPA: response regulator [Solirubrobacteraceae bacterium]|nr:response regulator [Solirubrobacteraceae bacterium]
MIRIAVLDRHPAVRAGVDAILRAQPGLAPAGAAADPRELWAVLYRTRPDVVLVEHDPGTRDGLAVCLRLKGGVQAPRVVLSAPDPGPELVVPATLAGADALVDRAAELRELARAIRTVAGGDRLLPAITPALQAGAAERLAAQDRAILAMRLAGTTPADIAATLGLSRSDLGGRLRAIVGALGARDGSRAPRDGDAPEIAVQALGAAA